MGTPLPDSTKATTPMTRTLALPSTDHDPFTPLFDAARPPTSLFDWASHLLADVLLKPGGDGVALYDRVVTHAKARNGPNPEPLDALLQAMGWTEDDMPDLSHNLFASAMGSVFERLAHSLFACTRPKLYSTDWASLAAAHGQSLDAGQGKRWGDFMLGHTAIELKYSYNSGQGGDHQAWCAQRLRAVGKTPVMLVLRPSQRTARMEKSGWTVYEGAQAVVYIERATGIHLGRLAQACVHHPLFAHHRDPRIARWRESRTAALEAGALNLPPHELAAYVQRLQQVLLDSVAA